MRSIDLVAVGGSKASQKVVVPLVTGKNVVGSDSKCNCQISLKLMQPKHFELLISKSGEITLIPQVDGLQIKMPNGKMKELSAYQVYSLDLSKHFYVERTLAFSFEPHVDKKGQTENGKTKGSLWNPKKTEEEVEPKKKQKKQQESEEEEVEEVEEEVQKKKTNPQGKSKGKQSNATKSNEKATKNKKKQVIEPSPVEESEEEEEEEEEIEEESPKQKPTRSNKPAVKSSKNQQSKEKKSEGTTKQPAKRVSLKKDNLKVILSNCELTPKQKEIMEKLGVTFTRDINDNFSIVIMEEFKRRVKLLVGLNKGAAILSKNWVLDCIDDKELITNFEEYFIEVSEEDSKKFDGFNLDEIQLSDSKKPRTLFSGYTFILPELPQETAHNEDLTAIIESGNGKISSQKSAVGKSKNVVQLIDKDSFKKLKSKAVKGVTYADPEFVLLSALKQEIQEQLIFH